MITPDIGEVTDLSSPSSFQVVRIDNESLPTGIAIPKAGHISIPMAFTPSNKAWSSPFCPAAAIQFADNLMSLIWSIFADIIFEIDSATDKRADAAGFNKATGGRSPIAIASPV